MIKNIADYLKITAERFPDKCAYTDEEHSITFKELDTAAKLIATSLLDKVNIGEPVLVYMEKSVECIESFLGVALSGAFYVPIDINMPYLRVKLIMDTLGSNLVLARHCDELPDEVSKNCDILYLEDIFDLAKDCIGTDHADGLKIEADKIDAAAIDEEAIAGRQIKSIDTNPAYAIFTSGSTGVPKGVLVSHRSVINFTEWWCETFDFTEREIFANQTPFYFDASVKDIYATLRCGATMHIIPKKLFMLPKKLVQFLNEKEVNCIDWVPSVLCMIANFKTLEKEKPLYLKKIMFLGEVMPTKQYNVWKQALPDVKFANLYGPTEATGDCTYYKIERDIPDDEPIPIGRACENTEVLLFDEEGRLVTGPGAIGEICVRGCSLALGYYNNPVKTEEAFIINPLQKNYKERLYKTGDLGKYNEYGEIIFLARKDSQIKHMGHRIELGEIETAIGAIEGINRVACLYEHKTQKIIAVYEGDIPKAELMAAIKERIPAYMMPSVFNKVETMPTNLNGKIDRVLLKEQFVSVGETPFL